MPYRSLSHRGCHFRLLIAGRLMPQARSRLHCSLDLQRCLVSCPMQHPLQNLLEDPAPQSCARAVWPHGQPLQPCQTTRSPPPAMRRLPAVAVSLPNSVRVESAGCRARHSYCLQAHLNRSMLLEHQVWPSLVVACDGYHVRQLSLVAIRRHQPEQPTQRSRTTPRSASASVPEATS